MPDSVTTTTRTGYGSRIIGSIKGILFGLVLFLVSFGVLYWNEGRVDLSKVAKTSTEISSASVNADSSLNGTLVSTSGAVTSGETVGDDLFLKPGAYLDVNRSVEMFAWVEKSESKTKTNTGGSQTTETTYTYVQEWTGSPADSSNFNVPAGHENPAMTIEDGFKSVSTAQIGAYSFDPHKADLPGAKDLDLKATDVNLVDGATLANQDYLFIKKSPAGTITTPGLGDMRVSYTALTVPFDGTLFGKLDGSTIDPFVTKKGDTLYRVFNEDRDSSIASMHSEHTSSMWILRLVGFMMMWFGLTAMFAPISVVLDVLPIFGTVSRTLIGMIAFGVALALSIMTIVVSAVLHSLLAVIIIGVLLVGGLIAGVMYWRKSKATAAPAV